MRSHICYYSGYNRLPLVYSFGGTATLLFFMINSPKAISMTAAAPIVPYGTSGTALNEVALVFMTFVRLALSFPVESRKNA